MTTKEAYNIPEVCQRAGSSRTSVYEAIKVGELVARKRGRRTIVLHDDLMAWLRRLPRMQSAGTEPRP